MAPRCAALILLLTACAPRAPLFQSSEAELEAPAESDLRIVTLNAWGVPFRHAHEALLSRLAERIISLDPDVVALQEVWFRDDADRLATALGEGGLVHVAHRTSDEILAHDSSGLLIASRYPITGVEFHRFSAGRSPFFPWHPDWFSGKGILLARVQAPTGAVDIANLHLQADYLTADYADVRAAQAVEAASFFRRRLSAPVQIVAGDFNSRDTDVEFRLMRAAAAAEPLVEVGIDAILSAGPAAGAPTHAGVTLVSPVEVAGESLRLSDHPGLYVDVRPNANADAWRPPPMSARLLSEIEGQLTAASNREDRLKVLAALSIALSLGALAWLRRRARMRRLGRRRRRRRLLAHAVALAVLVVAAHQLLWMIPSRQRHFSDAKKTLETLSPPP